MESRWSDKECRESLPRWLDVVRRLPQVREEKVERVRLALQNRTYENDSVLDKTVERLSRDVVWPH